MAITEQEAQWFQQQFQRLVDNVSRAVLGKEHTVRLALACMFSQGHLLLEDVPGTGKTSLARALAQAVQAPYKRIQFTPDLLPADVTGSTVYRQDVGQFEFRPGPLFASIVLADEINRASPKTQSALLEAMEEGAVTIEGSPHRLPEPFMVIATQNPIEQGGTYPLPEAQLDRFLIRTSLGYPDHHTTVALLGDAAVRDRAAQVEEMITAHGVGVMAEFASRVHVDPAILGYVSEIATLTRTLPKKLRLGLSVRGCLAYVRVAKTWALADGRTHVGPDDIRELAGPVLGHRLLLDPDAEFADVKVADVVREILHTVPVPVDSGLAGSVR